jgi:hypothetical protein
MYSRVCLLTGICVLFPMIVAAQCLSPTPECTELVAIRATKQMLVYRSHPFAATHADIAHAVAPTANRACLCLGMACWR